MILLTLILVIPVSLATPPKKTKSAANLLSLVSSVTKTKTSTPEKKAAPSPAGKFRKSSESNLCSQRKEGYSSKRKEG